MHVFNIATLVVILSLIGVELSVSAFVHPAARRLEPASQLQILSRFALVLGKVMPVWYPVAALLLAIQTWLNWRTPGRPILLAAEALWVLTSLASIFFLVPLNTRIAQGAAEWPQLHRTWDNRHRVRLVALTIAAILLTDVLAR